MRYDIPISNVYFWALPKLVKKRAKAFKQVLEHEKMRKVSILYEKMWGERYLVDPWTYCFESRLRSNCRSFSMRGESQVDALLVKLACQQPTCALIVQTHTCSSTNLPVFQIQTQHVRLVYGKLFQFLNSCQTSSCWKATTSSNCV